MQNIFFQGNSSTPAVNFDFDKGLVEISGRSIPENALKFYTPLIEWINEYQLNPKKTTTVNLDIEYFNILKQFADINYNLNFFCNNDVIFIEYNGEVIAMVSGIEK